MKWEPKYNLKSLGLHEEHYTRNKTMSPQHLPQHLECLTLQGYINNLPLLADKMIQWNLKYLCISFDDGIKGTLSSILRVIFPYLKTLIFRGCNLSSEDLHSLAQAYVEGKLPKLKHLDISHNNLESDEAVESFSHRSRWDQLLSLNIMKTRFSQDGLHKRVASGCLSSLQELRISEYPHQPISISWPCLRILGIDPPSKMMLSNIADAIEEGRFPGLHSVCIESQHLKEPELHAFSAFYRLTVAQISCHKCTVAPDIFPKVKCACQQKLM